MTRLYRDGFPHHVYSRGLNGNIIFYSTADCIYYVTLYSILSKKHCIVTNSFSLMPNHIHSLQIADCRDSFISFNHELNRVYATGYNTHRGRHGPVFDSPFGSAPKMVGKTIRSCISYINNNALVGGLAKHIHEFRWNLLAYRGSRCPFSLKISREHSSRCLRRALSIIDYNFHVGHPLDYAIQNTIFGVLNPIEKKQALDYALSIYNFLNYSGIDFYFGSFDKALLAMEANGGSEHDIQEDWEDYSIYTELSMIARNMGISFDSVNFEAMPTEVIICLAEEMLAQSRATKRQIEKYLHIKSGG